MLKVRIRGVESRLVFNIDTGREPAKKAQKMVEDMEEKYKETINEKSFWFAKVDGSCGSTVSSMGHFTECEVDAVKWDKVDNTYQMRDKNNKVVAVYDVNSVISITKVEE